MSHRVSSRLLPVLVPFPFLHGIHSFGVVFGIDRLIDIVDRRSARRFEGSAKVYMTRGIPVNEQRARIYPGLQCYLSRVRAETPSSPLRFRVFRYTRAFLMTARLYRRHPLAKRSCGSPILAPIDYCQPTHPVPVIARLLTTRGTNLHESTLHFDPPRLLTG